MLFSFMKLPVIATAFCLASSLAIAQNIECKIFSAEAGVGNNGAAWTAKSVATVDSQGGYKLTGGGCNGTPALNGEGYGSITSIPSGDSFTCVLTNNSQGARVLAYAIGCKTPRRARTLPAQFTNDGLGGGLVTVARTSNDFPDYTAKIPYSIRLCDSAGGARILVYYKKSTSDYLFVPFGQCLEIDQPNELIFATPDSVSITVGGQYELFPKGTFGAPRVTSAQSPPTKVAPDKNVKLGPEKTATAHCYLPTDANRPTIPVPGNKLDNSFIAYCPVSDLADKKNYQVCFDNGYSNQPSGALEYPGSLLPMILNPKLATQPFGATPDGTLYNSIAPGGCRDLFQVQQAYFVLAKTGPEPGNWLGQTVNDVTFRYREIIQ